MKFSDLKKLMIHGSDNVCARCKKPVQACVDLEAGKMPTGVLFKGQVYCFGCLEALATEIHARTQKEPQP